MKCEGIRRIWLLAGAFVPCLVMGAILFTGLEPAFGFDPNAEDWGMDMILGRLAAISVAQKAKPSPVATVTFGELMKTYEKKLKAEALEERVVVVGRSNVRQEPTTGAVILQKAGKQEQFQLLERNQDWYKVKLQDGREGWIFRRNARIEKVSPSLDWQAEERGDLHLVSFAFEKDGRRIGWYWEANTVSGWARLVNGNEALARKYDLFTAESTADGEVLLARLMRDEGSVIPIQPSPHILMGLFPWLYRTNPPTSGAHTYNPAKWGIHQEPIVKEVQVRNLEAGGVLIQYDCPQGCPEVVSKLEGIVKRFEGEKVALAPYPEMDRRIALTAWGRLHKFDEVDEERIIELIQAYLGSDRHEKIPSKSDGAAN